MIVKDGTAHFYCKRSKGMGGGDLDMQMVDMGIALCHFELAAKEAGLDVTFSLADPGLPPPNYTEYVASWLLNG